MLTWRYCNNGRIPDFGQQLAREKSLEQIENSKMSQKLFPRSTAAAGATQGNFYSTIQKHQASDMNMTSQTSMIAASAAVRSIGDETGSGCNSPSSGNMQQEHAKKWFSNKGLLLQPAMPPPRNVSQQADSALVSACSSPRVEVDSFDMLKQNISGNAPVKSTTGIKTAKKDTNH